MTGFGNTIYDQFIIFRNPECGILDAGYLTPYLAYKKHILYFCVLSIFISTCHISSLIKEQLPMRQYLITFSLISGMWVWMWGTSLHRCAIDNCCEWNLLENKSNAGLVLLGCSMRVQGADGHLAMFTVFLDTRGAADTKPPGSATA